MTHMIQDRIRIWIRLRIKTKTKTINEIVEDLQKEYKNKVQEHHDISGICETGKASEAIADRIYEKCYGSRTDKSSGRL